MQITCFRSFSCGTPSLPTIIYRREEAKMGYNRTIKIFLSKTTSPAQNELHLEHHATTEAHLQHTLRPFLSHLLTSLVSRAPTLSSFSEMLHLTPSILRGFLHEQPHVNPSLSPSACPLRPSHPIEICESRRHLSCSSGLALSASIFASDHYFVDGAKTVIHPSTPPLHSLNTAEAMAKQHMRQSLLAVVLEASLTRWRLLLV
mmetsp:Transcript_21175/g.31179  ORF Transcript_21175/g.31179 Transcript_21175/m.31179 type:complete len:203 (-) Transcript_21175:1490-2098(-)